MSDFKLLQDSTIHPGEMDWKRKSLAVCASDGDDGCVLWTVGPHVQFDITEGGLGNKLSDLGLDDAPIGISVWEGKTAGGARTWEGDYDDTYLVGTFRAPTDEEWAAIREGRCPWDDAPWFPNGRPSDGDLADMPAAG